MLRHFLLTTLLAGCSLTLLSQTESGSHMLGGQANIAGVFRDGSERFSFSLSPDYGYFVLDNFAVGTFLDISFIRLESSTRRFRFLVKPFARYYFPGQGKWRFFLHASAGGGLDRINLDDDLVEEIDPDAEDPSTRGLVEFDTGPGVNFFISPNVALEGYLFYEGNQREGEEDLTSRVGFRFGLQAFIFQRNKD